MGKIKFRSPPEDILLQLDRVTSASQDDAYELQVVIDRLGTCPAEEFRRKARLDNPRNPDPEDPDYVVADAVFEFVYFDSRRGKNNDILLFKLVAPKNRYLAYIAVHGEDAEILAFCHDKDSKKIGEELGRRLDKQSALS